MMYCLRYMNLPSQSREKRSVFVSREIQLLHFHQLPRGRIVNSLDLVEVMRGKVNKRPEFQEQHDNQQQEPRRQEDRRVLAELPQ